MISAAVPRPAYARPEPWGRWAAVAATAAVASLLCWLAGLPAPVLFGSLLGAVAIALGAPRLTASTAVPPTVFRLGQALIGVVIGTVVQVSTVSRLAEDWVAVALVVAGTLALSLATGGLLALVPGVGRATGVCSMVAGGASGIVAIAGDVGADDRTVAVVQYLRVLVVIVSLPVLSTLFFGVEDGGGSVSSGGSGSLASGLATMVLAVVAGAAALRWVPFPAAALLVPLAVAATLSATELIGDPAVPTVVEQAAYVVIGVAVGLRFTRESLRHVVRLLPWALGAIVLVVAGSALMGVLLSAATGVSQLTAYLATTPGGLFAVLPLAAGSGADVTFVLTLQVVRIVVMLAVAPLLARWLSRHQPGGG